MSLLGRPAKHYPAALSRHQPGRAGKGGWGCCGLLAGDALMCGIAGVLDLRHREAVSPRLMREMARAMPHRGPDDEGVYTRENLGLAHRRLSIIDLSSAGHQPMVSAGGSTVLVYNGMLYNYQELRAELQALGHRFVSQSDTEVILHGWEQHGEDFLPKMNGHFAFAVWDQKRRALFLVRDRYGTKPALLTPTWAGCGFSPRK